MPWAIHRTASHGTVISCKDAVQLHCKNYDQQPVLSAGNAAKAMSIESEGSQGTAALLHWLAKATHMGYTTGAQIFLKHVSQP